MDIFSPLLQIIEKIPELRFMYMGSYSSDEAPQFTKYSFEIFNSAPSNERGEHWIMIARWAKLANLLILWEDKVSTVPF